MRRAGRASGILLPIASLPSPYGIGAFSKEAYDFVDFVSAAGQRYWQILPLCPTGFGDSPYQSFSTYAGNPFFIDLDTLIADGLLTKRDVAGTVSHARPSRVDYEQVARTHLPLLRRAYERGILHGGMSAGKAKEFKAFCKKEADWLDDYALYMAVKAHFQNASWDTWEDDIRLRKPAAVKRYTRLLKEEIDYHKFVQYEFFTQWRALKAYAHEKGVRIIGDLPIYVAYDSADTWSHPELFQLEWSGQPDAVAGCPPDPFAATGQLWGNPLYRWEYHKETDYAWWVSRLRHTLGLYDVVRIDHFRGFESYYSIPYGDPTAEFGHWEKGPGNALFEVLKREIPEIVEGELRLIAEDLGFLTPGVRRLLKRTGFPGMKVLQFAFDAREDSDYLPYNYDANSIVYTGTHDNNTTRGWFEEISKKDRAFAYRFLQIPKGTKPSDKGNVDAMIRLALASVSNTAIIPLQDYLTVGVEGRINKPSTVSTRNWSWRVKGSAITPALARRIRALCTLYGRSTL